MDFYAHQDKARRKTGQLIALFFLSAVLIVVAVNLAAYGIFHPTAHKRLEMCQAQGAVMVENCQSFFHALVGFHIVLSLIVLAMIALISWRRIKKLGSSGGDWLASELGGIFVDPEAPGGGNPHLRRLVNVVDEMVIAANIPRPNIYVLESEPGINALAAGWDHENAVIVVSRGALLQLSRDELQGVIAHEISHILSGDMRLNIRLIGLLAGLLALSLGGKKLLSRRSGIQWLIFGTALMVIGSLGVFCGRLIRAGVSRQREFLADAQAVRLTRNPDGLAGALKKIGGFREGSQMKMARREEVSHMFFASGQTFWTRFLATHPPLEERIGAIQSHFKRQTSRSATWRPTNWGTGQPAAFQDSGTVFVANPPDLLQRPPAPAKSPAAAHSIAVDGETGGRKTRLSLLADGLERRFHVPKAFLGEIDNCEAALLFALLQSRRVARKRKSGTATSDDRDTLYALLGDALYSQVTRLMPKIKTLLPEQILPLAEMVLPKLDVLIKRERLQVIRMLERMAALDDELTPAEYCLTRMTRLRLTEAEKTAHVIQPKPAQKPPAAQLRQAIVTLFAVIAWHGGPDDEAAARAFAAGMVRLLPKSAPAYTPPTEWVAAFDKTLELLPTLPPAVKKQVIDALLVTITWHGAVTLDELELLRLITVALELPMPSFNAMRQLVEEKAQRPARKVSSA